MANRSSLQTNEWGHPLAGLVSIGNKISKAFARRHVYNNEVSHTHPIHFIRGYGTDPHQTPIGIKVITVRRDTPASSEAQKTVGTQSCPIAISQIYGSLIYESPVSWWLTAEAHQTTRCK